jgi:acetyltransferase-like isoleucine patch superfamily enzyme
MRFKLAILFYLLKRLLLIYKGYNIGEKSQIERGVNLDKLNCNGIKIGNNTLVAKGCVILSHSHPRRSSDDKPVFYNTKIGNNCFIGINSIIQPGITIGDEVIIGDGSVVTKNIPKGSFAAGNPAVVIKTIECGFFGKLKSN